MPTEIEAKVEQIKQNKPVQLPKPAQSDVKFIEQSKDEAKIGVGLDSMVKAFKDIGSKIDDVFKGIRFVNLVDIDQ